MDTPPRPPTKLKKDIVPDLSVFAAIDDHALQASINLRTNIDNLVQYLKQPAKNDLEKVRAFYRWITNNICYDTESYLAGQKGDESPKTVLLSGKSICEGYAGLFQEFCRMVDIPAKKIPGYAKGYSWKPGNVVTTDQETYHAWNAVLIEGEWRFVDCTWGAGYLDDDCQFIWYYSDVYFLTDPVHFAVGHFPYMNKDMEASSTWQLLEKPISLETFCSSLNLEPLAMELGLTPLSHSTEVITVGSSAEIQFSYPPGQFESFRGKMKAENGDNMDDYTLVETLNQALVTVHLIPPEQGKYFLDFFGQPEGREKKVQERLLTYKVNCTDPPKCARKFPNIGQHLGPWPNFKDYGFTEEVCKKVWYVADKGQVTIPLGISRDVEILASIQHSDRVIDSPKKFCFIAKTDTAIYITVKLPFEGFYKFTVSAKRPWSNDNLFWEAITYLIECREPMDPCRPFPVQYAAANKLNAQLIEPLDGELQANREIMFRIKGPSIQRIMVKNVMLEKRDDVFEGTVKTPNAAEKFSVFGSLDATGNLDGLFKYEIVQA